MLYVRVDKLTKNIEERATGARLNSIIAPVSLQQIKCIHKKDGWKFDWKKEYKQNNRQIYQLTVEGKDTRVQGLISMESKGAEQFIELHLIEMAPHNFGSKKEYYNVARSLVAFACKYSFELGFDGCVAFYAKTILIQHYENSFGAILLRGPNRMGIFRESALYLVNLYYKQFYYGQ